MPVLLIEQLKVATPPEALTGLVVQLRVPPPGLVAMARVTGADEVVTTLPRASSTDTPVVKFVPAVELAGGCVVTTSEAAAPGVMLNAAGRDRREPGAGGREGVAGARLVDRAAEGGHATGGVDRVGGAAQEPLHHGLVAIARVTGAVDVVTTLPRESSTETPVVKFVPATVFVGWRRDDEFRTRSPA